MKRIFLTFGDSRLKKSAKRIRSQAISMGIYDQILITNENDLDPTFKNKFQKHLVKGSRGFGFWCWKPQIILQTLTSMGTGDILHWQDIGCHLNVKGSPRLYEYLEMACSSSYGILPFQFQPLNVPIVSNGQPVYDFLEKQWTKGDLFEHFNATNNKNITDSEQMSGTVLFLQKRKNTVRFIKDWLEPFQINFSLVDDSQSKYPNFDEFIEHRHDQSVLSILCKLEEIDGISASEFEGWWTRSVPNEKMNWNTHSEQFPIHNLRDKEFGMLRTIGIKSRNLLSRKTRALFSK